MCLGSLVFQLLGCVRSCLLRLRYLFSILLQSGNVLCLYFFVRFTYEIQALFYFLYSHLPLPSE